MYHTLTNPPIHLMLAVFAHRKVQLDLMFVMILNPPSLQLTTKHLKKVMSSLTGGPTASMMSVENPEAFAEIVFPAQGENQTPLFIMTDTNFEAISNPEKFPYSTGCFSAERPRRLTYQEYFK